MAMINCEECGYQYSDRSAACPNCGAPTPGAGQMQPTRSREVSRSNADPDLLADVQDAHQVCLAANEHFVVAGGYQDKINSIRGLYYLLNMVSIGAGIFFFFVGLELFSGGFIAGVLTGVAVKVVLYYLMRMPFEAKIKGLREKIAKEQGVAQKIFDANAEALSCLPADYWYPLATEYMLKVIRAGRARNINEALDMFDAQLHRWKVEEANAQIMAQQQAQTEMLRSIQTSSAYNAYWK